MNKPTREQARAVTAVFWDINLCPVPSGFDPSRVLPCIKRYLENRGYSSLVTITAIGILTNIPTRILRGLYSSGVSLISVPYGSGTSDDISGVIFTFTENNPPSKANIMVISDPKIFIGVDYLYMTGHHLLQPCPFDSLRSLLKQDSGAPEEAVESAFWDCLVCRRDPPGRVFENLITHLSSEEHQHKHNQVKMSDLRNNNNDNEPFAPICFHPHKTTLMTWKWCPLFREEPHYLTKQEAVTFVFWDINTYPVPRCSDAPLVAPCIKRFLVEEGYSGPCVIIAVGLFKDVPVDILRGVSSSGISFTNLPYGTSDIERLVCEFTDTYEHPANIMVISVAKISALVSGYLEMMDYNLQQFPYTSLQSFLPADSGALEEYKCSETRQSASYWICSVCHSGLTYKGVDSFTLHLSSYHHQLMLDRLPPPRERIEKDKEAITLVFWDIKTCPVPPYFDPRMVGPSIKGFLEKSGYTGPLTITAVGVLTEVPNDILRGVYYGGITLDNNSNGSSSVEHSVYDYTLANPPPANIMVICDPKVCDITFQYLTWKRGYNLLIYDSLESFLPEVSVFLEGDKCKCSEMRESACCVCSDCCHDDVEKDFEKFSTHLSSRAHQRRMLDFLPSNARFSRQEEDASYHGDESSKGEVQETEGVNKNKRKTTTKKNNNNMKKKK